MFENPAKLDHTTLWENFLSMVKLWVGAGLPVAMGMAVEVSGKQAEIKGRKRFFLELFFAINDNK